VLLALGSLGGIAIARGSRPAPAVASPRQPGLTVTLSKEPVLAAALPRRAAPRGASAASSAGSAVSALLSGIPQSGTVLGDPRAPVTMQLFSDLECPYCRRLALGAQSTLIRRYVRSGKLKIEFRSLRSATRSPLTFRAQQAAALAAGRQDKLWYFVELFYREQGREGSGYVTPAYLLGIARQVPALNLAAWNAARSSPLLTATLDRDEQAALQRGVSGTPAVLIGRTGGRLGYFVPPSLVNASAFEVVIGRLLRAHR
jgi:protein-disulfide isomerase